MSIRTNCCRCEANVARDGGGSAAPPGDAENRGGLRRPLVLTSSKGLLDPPCPSDLARGRLAYARLCEPIIFGTTAFARLVNSATARLAAESLRRSKPIS